MVVSFKGLKISSRYAYRLSESFGPIIQESGLVLVLRSKKLDKYLLYCFNTFYFFLFVSLDFDVI